MKHKFLECVQLMPLDCKKGVRQDVPTRWNSIYHMLETVQLYCCAFVHLSLTDTNYQSCPSTNEWIKVDFFCKFLKPFYEVTTIFSGSKYHTANLYFSKVCIVYVTLKNGIESEYNYIRNMESQMLTKFEKYWYEFSLIFAFVGVLNPRFKLQFVDFSCKKLQFVY